MTDYVSAGAHVQHDAASSGGEAERNALLHSLVQTHKQRLYRFILRNIGHQSDAQDLAQQAFLEAVRSFQLFKGESELSTWLYGIAMNLVRNYLSRSPHRRYEFIGEDALDGETDPRLSPQDSLEQAQQLRYLQQALSELPPTMQEIFMLVAVDEVSYEEAAVLLSVPIGTVRSRLSRARNALRARLVAAGV